MFKRGYESETMISPNHVQDPVPTDKTHSLLHERILGREGDLRDPQLRAALILQLAEETQIHAAFIEGFLDGLDDPNSSSFETRKTQRLIRAAK